MGSAAPSLPASPPMHPTCWQCLSTVFLVLGPLAEVLRPSPVWLPQMVLSACFRLELQAVS